MTVAYHQTHKLYNGYNLVQKRFPNEANQQRASITRDKVAEWSVG